MLKVSIVVMDDGDDDGDDDAGVDVDNIENDAYSRASWSDAIDDIFYDDNDSDGECNERMGTKIYDQLWLKRSEITVFSFICPALYGKSKYTVGSPESF